MRMATALSEVDNVTIQKVWNALKSLTQKQGILLAHKIDIY